MNERSKAVRLAILHTLSGQDEWAVDCLDQEWPDGNRSEDLCEQIAKFPELEMIDHIARIMSGERAEDRSEVSDLAELKTLVELFTDYSERLIEIGQENNHEGLLFAASMIRQVGESIAASVEHHKGLRVS